FGQRLFLACLQEFVQLGDRRVALHRAEGLVAVEPPDRFRFFFLSCHCKTLNYCKTLKLSTLLNHDTNFSIGSADPCRGLPRSSRRYQDCSSGFVLLMVCWALVFYQFE